jgi:DNA-binding MarR family transcriptional regulator
MRGKGDRGVVRRKSTSTSANEEISLSDSVLLLAKFLEILRRDVLAKHDLEPWEYDVLSALRTAETSDGTSPSDLRAALRIASGTVTNRVDRLVSRGYVARKPDPRDGRGTLVQLRTPGRKRVESATRDLARTENAAWQAISPARRAQLAACLPAALTALEPSRSP